MPHRVLIAHQSTIPHYRVRFYELLEQMRPPEWTFDVVYDTRESTNPRVYIEAVDHTKFQFPILATRTRILSITGQRLIYQGFLHKALSYDLIITDTHLNNISYPLASLLQLAGKKRIFWGHFRDMNVEKMQLSKRVLEAAKHRLVRSASACFAYTAGTAEELIRRGYPTGRVTVLNNTIDTKAERSRFERRRGEREAIRAQWNLTDRKVLLFVGRLIPEKRIPFLMQLFAAAHRADPSYHLVVVGAGPMDSAVISAFQKMGKEAITYAGAVSDPEQLAPYYIAADAYILTGMVGLAPLQALCYNLPIIVFDELIHSPEVEYLNGKNSVMLPRNVSPGAFPDMLHQALERFPFEIRDALYESIRHLTLENMATRFIEGVNSTLKR